jgi:hypothetical protein
MCRYHECGCIDPIHWTARTVVLRETGQIIIAPLCNSSVTCYRNATDRIVNTISIWNDYCSDCTEECSNVNFIVTPSSVSAPVAPLFSNIKTFVELSSIPLPMNWSTTWQTEIVKNYISIDVLAETTRVEIYRQVPAMSGVDLLSNVGGHTGLWIGISFLSLMELVEMFYRLIRYQWFSFRHRLRRQTFTTDNEHF